MGTQIDELLEQVGTEEHGKMLKGIQILEVGRVRAKEAQNWMIEGQKRRITRKEHRRLRNEFEMGGFMTQKGQWNLARRKMPQDRGAVLEEEGDIVREYKAIHEETILRSWLKKVGQDKKERKMEVDTETKEEVSEKRIREEVKDENETLTFF